MHSSLFLFWDYNFFPYIKYENVMRKQASQITYKDPFINMEILLEV